MAVGTLLAAGAVSIGVGVSFGVVARATGRMKARGAGAWALRGYSLWWAALAAYLIIQGGLTVLASYGRLSAALYDGSRYVTIPILCLGVWGLTSYLLYLYTGDRRVFPVVAAFYGVVAALFYAAHFGPPDRGIDIQQWLVTTDGSSTLYEIVYLLVGLPPIIAALAYLGLLGRTETRRQNYRIALVASSILAYVGSGLVARLSARDAWVFVTLVLFGALAAAASLLAYYPPPRLRAWLESTPDQRAAKQRERKRSMKRRIRQLI